MEYQEREYRKSEMLCAFCIVFLYFLIFFILIDGSFGCGVSFFHDIAKQPYNSTTISAWASVEALWAMTMVVRPSINLSRASFTSCSDL